MIQLPHNTLVIATHNPGKAEDIFAILAPLGLKLLSAKDLNLPSPEETATTFEGNARIKSEAAAIASGFAALGDDSGLEVPALNGAPGVYTADWAGPDSDYRLGMKRIETEMAGQSDHRVCFTTALSLTLPNGPTHVFKAHLWGTLSFPPRGDKAYGYCPIFIPNNETRTLGEMNHDERNAISHRRQALNQLMAALKE